MIAVEADLRGVTNVMGIYSSIIRDFSRSKNLDTFSKYAAEVTIQSFNETMDIRAERGAAEFGHMYDWGELGEESGRLWRVIMGGSPQNKVVTWDYRASENDVPRNVNDKDRRRTTEVFKWKAPMIENGQRARISPTLPHGLLAIPTNEPLNYNGDAPPNKGGTMWFTRHDVMSNINYVAKGAFTQAWMVHFGTIAIRIVEETVVRETEVFFNTYSKEFKKLPKPKVSARPARSKTHLESKLGEYLGRKKNGQFMDRMERRAQALRIIRIGDGLG